MRTGVRSCLRRAGDRRCGRPAELTREGTRWLRSASGSRRTTTASWACRTRRPPRRSRARTGSCRGSTTRTTTRATPPPRSASRRCRRPTTSSATTSGARSTTRCAGSVRPLRASPAARVPAGSSSRTPVTSATCSAASSVDRRGGGRGGRGPHRGQDLETELHLTFDDAVAGVTTAVHLTSDAPCRTLQRLGRQGRHRAAPVLELRWARRRVRQPGSVLVVVAVPGLRGSRESSSTTPARRVAAPESSAARVRSRFAFRRGWTTRSASA